MDWFGLKQWRYNRILRRNSLTIEAWQRAIAPWALLRGLSDGEQKRLRDLTILFMHEKSLMAADGYEIDAELRIKIAAQACLPILNLGLDYYSGWVSVIVYPGEFVPAREVVDASGVVHVQRDAMMGEAWPRGPVILSAADVLRSGAHDGANVVIHEFAHKLDMRNGPADGFPPLHRGMSIAEWSKVFQAAYEDFCARIDADAETAIDPYAGQNPAEFFAVLSEVFFETPHTLLEQYPAVYQQLARFYRQDPVSRMECVL